MVRLALPSSILCLIFCVGCPAAPDPAAPATSEAARGQGHLVAEPHRPGPLAAADLALNVHGRDVPCGQPVPLVVENLAKRADFLRRAVAVQTEIGNAWRPVDPPVRGLFLRRDCRPDARSGLLNPPGFATSCVELESGGTFRSQPWLGGHGDGQCACDKCVPVRSGRYRFVIQTCDGRRSVFGEPFRLRGPGAAGQ